MTACGGGVVTADLCGSLRTWYPDQDQQSIYLVCEPDGSGRELCVGSSAADATHVAMLDWTDRWTVREKRLKVIDNEKIEAFCNRSDVVEVRQLE